VATRRARREVTIQASGQAALIQPMVTFQLRDPHSGKPLAAQSGGLEVIFGRAAGLASRNFTFEPRAGL